jgi:diaminopimelate decarboxylase
VGGAFKSVKQASKELLKQGLRHLVARAGSKPGIPPEQWGLRADGALSWEGVDLPRLCVSYGSPLHVVSRQRLRDNARRFLTPPNGGAAGCEIFYSYKTNPVPGVLAELHSVGIGAEVISHYELWLALKLGTPPSRIVYNGPAKSEASIRQAIELGIELLNINHREEVAVVARVARELGRRPRVGVRVTLGGWAAQFGTPVAGGEALAVYEEALGTGCLDVVALHVHRGGMMHSEGEAASYVDEVLAFADELKQRLGVRLEILDLGGSLAPRTVRGLTPRELRLNRTLLRELTAPNPNEAMSIEAYVKQVTNRVSEHYRKRGETVPRVFLEPGRSLTSDAQLLLTTVLGIKKEGEKAYVILDAGINIAESCRSEYHQILSANRHGVAPTRPYTLVGPICTPGDTLRWAVRLPELSVGDTLAIMDAGAYFVPFATSFSFPRPGIVMLEDGEVQTLRRPETFEDLASYDAPQTLPRAATSAQRSS